MGIGSNNKEWENSKDKNRGEKNRRPNTYALAQSVLFLMFGLILLGLQKATLELFGYEWLDLPLGVYTGLGIAAIVVSLFFMLVAVFCAQLAIRVERYLGDKPKSRRQAIFQYLCWVVFLLVYTVSWMQGLSRIPGTEIAHYVGFSVGFVIFWIIGSIPFIPLAVRLKNVVWSGRRGSQA